MATNLRTTSGCNSTQSAKSASATDSSAFLGRNLTATRTLPGTVQSTQAKFILYSIISLISHLFANINVGLPQMTQKITKQVKCGSYIAKRKDPNSQISSNSNTSIISLRCKINGKHTILGEQVLQNEGVTHRRDRLC